MGMRNDRQSQNDVELFRNMLQDMGSLRDLLQESEMDVNFWATLRYPVEALGSDEAMGKGIENRRMRRAVVLELGDDFEGSSFHALHGASGSLEVKVFDDDRSFPMPLPDLCLIWSRLLRGTSTTLPEGMFSFQIAMSRISSQSQHSTILIPFSPNLSPLLQSRRHPWSALHTSPSESGLSHSCQLGPRCC